MENFFLACCAKVERYGPSRADQWIFAVTSVTMYRLPCVETHHLPILASAGAEPFS